MDALARPLSLTFKFDVRDEEVNNHTKNLSAEGIGIQNWTILPCLCM